jgi:hypothetical protein
MENKKKFILSVRDKTGKYQFYNVSEEVYIYVKQLESYIKTGKGNIKKIYKGRLVNKHE